jgi:hypothetical protein
LRVEKPDRAGDELPGWIFYPSDGKRNASHRNLSKGERTSLIKQNLRLIAITGIFDFSLENTVFVGKVAHV